MTSVATSVNAKVDLVINRSIVYASLTALLALVFAGGGLALQRTLGQDRSPVAFAISTAAAGLLFNPARKRVQRFVDRRIYGLRFDLNDLNRVHAVTTGSPRGALTGRTLGKYNVRGLVGRGGMGEVYEGECLGRRVALKVLTLELGHTDARKWFQRESEVLAALEHPNIVRLLESGVSETVYYLALEFIDGRVLTEVIRERWRLPLADVCLLVRDCAHALDYAHRRGRIREPKALPPQLTSKDPILFDQIAERLPLVASQPADHHGQKHLQDRDVDHSGSLSHGLRFGPARSWADPWDTAVIDTTPALVVYTISKLYIPPLAALSPWRTLCRSCEP